MSKLIEELKSEHKLLVSTLTEVKGLGISNPAAQKKMMAAKEALIAHLKKEDTELYPKLDLAAATNKDLQNLIDLFVTGLEDVANAAMEFFNKYENGGTEIEFAGDFGKLSAALTLRIRREEEKLYPEYEKLKI